MGTPSAASGGTVSPAGSVGAERSPPESCAPVGGGRPPHRGGCRQRRLGEYESSCTSCNLLGQKALAGFLRTSYPRSRSANSPRTALLPQNRASWSLLLSHPPHIEPGSGKPPLKFRNALCGGIFLSLRVKLHFVQLTRSSFAYAQFTRPSLTTVRLPGHRPKTPVSERSERIGVFPALSGHRLKFRRAKPRGIFPVPTSQVALRATYSVKSRAARLVRPQPKIPERPSAEGFSCPVWSHTRAPAPPRTCKNPSPRRRPRGGWSPLSGCRG